MQAAHNNATHDMLDPTNNEPRSREIRWISQFKGNKQRLRGEGTGGEFGRAVQHADG